MGMGIGFRATPEQSKAINSGLDSVSSGIQEATKTSSPAEVSAWLKTYSSSFPALQSSLSGKASFVDSASMPSPQSYLNSAKQFGGQKTLSNFSDLVPMDKVEAKLGDAKFNQQKSLQGFSNALKNLEFDDPGFNPTGRSRMDSPKVGDPGFTPKGKLPSDSPKIGDPGFTPSGKLPTDFPKIGDPGFTSSGKLPVDFPNVGDPGFTPKGKKHTDLPNIGDPGFTPPSKLPADFPNIGDPGFTPKGKQTDFPNIGDSGFSPAGKSHSDFPGIGDAGFTPPSKLPVDFPNIGDPGFNLADLAKPLNQDTDVNQRLSDFRGTLQDIVSLSDGIPGK